MFSFNQRIFKIIFWILIIWLSLLFFFLSVYPHFTYSRTLLVQNQTINFEIIKGENLEIISRHLKEANLIKSPFLFKLYVIYRGWPFDLKSGYYRLSADLGFKKIAEIIHQGLVDPNQAMVIKEGLTIKEIEDKLKANKIIASDVNLSQFYIRDFKNDKNQEIFFQAPPDNVLEGYLFPDTYYFCAQSQPSEIINQFLINFNNKIVKTCLPEIKKQNKNFYEVLIMASILEKEVQTEIDKRMVADILWRRLKEGIPLQVDASICYAQNQSFDDCQLIAKAFKIDSPYNTYLYKGLPPAPICNPGLESIKAALNPLPNQSWYYLTDRKTGKTIYSKTYEEHLKMRQKYL